MIFLVGLLWQTNATHIQVSPLEPVSENDLCSPNAAPAHISQPICNQTLQTQHVHNTWQSEAHIDAPFCLPNAVRTRVWAPLGHPRAPREPPNTAHAMVLAYARSHMPGAICPEPYAQGRVPGATCPEPCARSQMPGAICPETYARSHMPGNT